MNKWCFKFSKILFYDICILKYYYVYSLIFKIISGNIVRVLEYEYIVFVWGFKIFYVWEVL